MLKNKILIIGQSFNYKEIISFTKKYKKNDKIVFVNLNDNFNENFIKENIIFKKYSDYISITELKKINKKALIWIKKWPNLEIKNNKNFKELVTYKNFSMWWLVEFWFYNASMYYYYSVVEIIKSLEIIEHIIRKEKPNEIILIDDKKLFSIVTKIFAKFKKIKLIVDQDFTANLKYKIIKHSTPFVIKFFKNTKSNIRELFSKLTNFHRSIKREKFKILMFTHPVYRHLSINPVTNEAVNEDIILGPLIRELRKNKKYEITLLDSDPFPSFRFDFIFDRNYNHIEGYLTQEIKKYISQKAKEFSIIWEKLKREKSFIDSLTYKKIPIFELLEDKFSELFHRRFIEAIKYIEMMKQVIKTETPKIMVIVDEYGLYGRSAIVAAKLNNIPTLAIQHGSFTRDELGYFHYSNEIFIKKSIDPNYCPIPDITSVSGEYYKNILIDFGSYPKNSVVVTGQPKYDILANANIFFEKRKFYDKFSIDYQKKVILFATQPLSKNESELLLRSVYTEIKKLPNVQLLVKPHPNEYDVSLHQQIAKEVDLDIILIKDINLFELLNACDVLITLSSTVALEAMVLEKPVIIVDLKIRPYEISFVKSGAAIGVYRPRDIGPSVIKVLNNQKTIKKLQSNMRRFVYNHAYKIDGLASKRITELIENMIKK